MRNLSRTFLKSESGAVTVDWVVLTAGLVGLGLATMTVVSSGVEQTATDIDEELSTEIIQTKFILAPRDAWLEALKATCTHSTGWGCEGVAAHTAEVATLEGLDDTALQAGINSLEASRLEHIQKQETFAAMLQNFDPENPDYSVFQGLWTTWDNPATVQTQMGYHTGGDPAAYAVYLDNQVELLYQAQRSYEEHALGKDNAADFTTHL